MKFSDLEFKPHPSGGTYAVYKFANGYAVVVVSSETYGSNGVDTYEVSINNPKGELEGRCRVDLKKAQVTKLMKEIANYGT